MAKTSYNFFFNRVGNDEEWLELVNKYRELIPPFESVFSEHVGKITINYETEKLFGFFFGKDILEANHKFDLASNTVLPFEKFGKVENRKLLEISVSPITVNQDHFFPSSILLANKRNMTWYHNNYVNLSSNIASNGKSIRIDYHNVMYDQLIEKKIIAIEYNENTSADQLLQILKEKISENLYVSVCLQHFGIPALEAYNKWHFHHHCLIYGYDDEQKTLNAMGMTKGRIFREFTMTYPEFMEAIYPEENNYFGRTWVDFHTYEKKPQDAEFDKNSFVQSLYEYLSGEPAYDSAVIENNIQKMNLPEYAREIYKSGINVVDVIARSIIEGYEGFRPVDFPAIHLLSEHKKKLLDTFNYVYNNYYNDGSFSKLLAEYDTKVVSRYEKIRMKYLKQQYTNTVLDENMTDFGKEAMVDIARLLMEAKKGEAAVTSKILDYMLLPDKVRK